MSRNKEILKRKKILFVEQNQDGTVGGSHYCLLSLIKHLDKKKYKPVVMFYENNEIINKFIGEKCEVIIFQRPFGKRFEPPNIIVRLSYLTLQKVYNLTKVSLIPFTKFMWFIIWNNIDLIHLNNTARTGWEWLFAAKLLHKRCITHERGFARYSWISAKVASYFDKIICVSDAIESSIVKHNLEKNSCVLYDGMYPNMYKEKVKKNIDEVKREFGVEDSRPFIGMVGNFQEWKGQRIVIRAVDIVKKKYPKVLCLLIGSVSSTYGKDIEYFDSVVREIDDQGLKENVIITGYRADVPDLVSSLDILIHASIMPEPFGMVILEGMCLEKPVIATDIGGPREIIEDGVSGILVSPGKPIILAEKIEYLLEHPGVRQEIGKNAFKRVLDKFSLEDFSSQINNLYDRLFSK